MALIKKDVQEFGPDGESTEESEEDHCDSDEEQHNI